MPRRIAVIQGHPDPDPARLCRALADAYADGAIAAGHAVERVDLASLDVPLLRTQAAFEQEPVPESLRPAADAIVGADHVVLVFPLWLGTMPALVKAFAEQVFRPRVAFRDKEGGFPEGMLKGRSARLIVTMGMPAIAYRWWFRSHGIKALERNILKFVGIAPVRTTLFGMVHAASAERRQAWLKRMRDLGSKAA